VSVRRHNDWRVAFSLRIRLPRTHVAEENVKGRTKRLPSASQENPGPPFRCRADVCSAPCPLRTDASTLEQAGHEADSRETGRAGEDGQPELYTLARAPSGRLAGYVAGGRSVCMRLSREGDKEREQLGLCVGHGDTASSSDFGLSADWRHNCEGKYIPMQ
jgi:hypothetical protein